MIESGKKEKDMMKKSNHETFVYTTYMLYVIKFISFSTLFHRSMDEESNLIDAQSHLSAESSKKTFIIT